MVHLTVSSAGKPPAFAKGLPITLNVSNGTTIADVKANIAKQFPKFYPSRQKLTLKGERKALADDAKLSQLSIVDGAELVVKDLGPQVSWTTVFLVEYFGPLAIHAFMYYFPALVYGRTVRHSALQKYSFGLVALHFLKREFETLFVHRFSHGTMPLFNIFKNSAHYWVLSGVLLAYDLYRPAYAASSPFVKNTIRDNPTFLLACGALHLFLEMSNLSTHLTLRSLRPAGTTRRAIPYGYGFSMISCPNYFFESLVWVTLALMTQSYAAWLFTAVSTGQMAIWAAKKHANYKKEFGKEYPKRYKMIPFIF